MYKILTDKTSRPAYDIKSSQNQVIMIGAADGTFDRDSDEDICASCCKLTNDIPNEWQEQTRHKYSSNAEKKGYLLQQIQIAANLQDVYQPSLKHLQQIPKVKTIYPQFGLIPGM